MGGCPNGPSAQVPPTPRSVAIVRSMDKTSLQVNWAAVTAVPAADPVDGYSVDLIATTASAAGEHQQRGIRTPTSVTKATFNALDPAETYTVEVRSMAAGHMSDAGVPSPPPDTTLPTITMSPKPSADSSPVAAPDGVTLSSSNGGQIYYTTDSSAPINGDMPSDKAKLYTDPIPVPGPGTTEIRAAAFDNAGNNVEVQGFYKPPDPIAPAPAPATAPAPPAGLTGTGGLHKVSLTWTAGDATVTDYRVVAYKGAAIVSTTPATTNGVTVDGLTAGDSYTFTVAAKNTTGWSTESAPTSPIQATDAVTVGSARWKLGDFRVTGTGTDIGGVTVYDAATDKPIPGATATMTAAVAPATGTTFDIRLRNAQAPNPKPAKVYVKSSLGGASAPLAVIG
jgi:hypothetical protein